MIGEKNEWAQAKEQWDREREELTEEQNKLKAAYEGLKSEAEMNDWKAKQQLVSRTKSSDSDRNFREFEKERTQWGRKKEELREENDKLKESYDTLKSEAKSNWKSKKMSVSGQALNMAPLPFHLAHCLSSLELAIECTK